VAVQPSCNPVGWEALIMRVEPDKREDLMGRPRRWLPQAGRLRGTAHQGRTSTPGPYRQLAAGGLREFGMLGQSPSVEGDRLLATILGDRVRVSPAARPRDDDGAGWLPRAWSAAELHSGRGHGPNTSRATVEAACSSSAGVTCW